MDPFTMLDGDAAALAALLAEQPQAAGARDGAGVSLALQARYRGRLDLVDVVLAASPALDVFDAAGLGRVDRLAELLDEDPGAVAAVSGDGFTPLHLAAFFGHLDAARLLLDRGADPAAVAANPMAVQPLHSAAAGGATALAELLLDRGAPPDARQHGGFTPLHAAAQHGDERLVARLLAAGADPAAATDDGRTAADLAAAAGHDDLADRLRSA